MVLGEKVLNIVETSNDLPELRLTVVSSWLTRGLPSVQESGLSLECSSPVPEPPIKALSQQEKWNEWEGLVVLSQLLNLKEVEGQLSIYPQMEDQDVDSWTETTGKMKPRNPKTWCSWKPMKSWISLYDTETRMWEKEIMDVCVIGTLLIITSNNKRSATSYSSFSVRWKTLRLNLFRNSALQLWTEHQPPKQ